MPSTMSSLLLGAAIGASGALAQTLPPSFGVKFTDGIEVLNQGYLGGLPAIPAPSYTRTRWAWGTVPEACYFEATQNNKCNPYDLEVYDVTYNDCTGMPITICRCNNSPMSIDQLTQAVAKLPVKGRQWTSYVSSFVGNGCGAHARGMNIAIMGTCQQSAFFHELGHVLDLWALGTNGQSYWSAGPTWPGIVLMGQCVATYYSKQSAIEHGSWLETHAEVAVMAAYNANVQSIWNLHVDCMADQMGKGIEQFDALLRYQSSATCNRVWGKTPTVCMGPAANCAANLRTVAAKDPVIPGVVVEHVPVIAPEAQKKIDEIEAIREIEAAKAAGWEVAKNGTLVFPGGAGEVNKRGGVVAKGFKA